MDKLAVGSSSPKFTHHYGRGGAGNVTSKEGVFPESKVTPTLKSKKYTTGRGGAGNMADNDFENPEEARESQDVDVPAIMLPESTHRTGRGGVANTYQPSEEEAKKAKEHNERIRRESFNRKNSGGLRQKLVEKAKEKLPEKSATLEV